MSTKSKTTTRTPLLARSSCVSCSNVDLSVHLQAAPCGHFYCRDCLQRMAQLALQDRALVPLRCCRKELPIECVQFAFTGSASSSSSMARGTSDLARYQKLLEERTRAWQNSDLVSDAEYAATVRCVGAKQCPGCGIGVQRDFGCVHMTCPSGHQFCFTCLRVWRTCQCELIPDQEIRTILGE